MEFAPTPIQFLWEDEQGNRLYVKREDLLPYSFGGNKVRIGLEYLFLRPVPQRHLSVWSGTSVGKCIRKFCPPCILRSRAFCDFAAGHLRAWETGRTVKKNCMHTHAVLFCFAVADQGKVAEAPQPAL